MRTLKGKNALYMAFWTKEKGEGVWGLQRDRRPFTERMKGANVW